MSDIRESEDKNRAGRLEGREVGRPEGQEAGKPEGHIPSPLVGEDGVRGKIYISCIHLP